MKCSVSLFPIGSRRSSLVSTGFLLFGCSELSGAEEHARETSVKVSSRFDNWKPLFNKGEKRRTSILGPLTQKRKENFTKTRKKILDYWFKDSENAPTDFQLFVYILN